MYMLLMKCIFLLFHILLHFYVNVYNTYVLNLSENENRNFILMNVNRYIILY